MKSTKISDRRIPGSWERETSLWKGKDALWSVSLPWERIIAQSEMTRWKEKRCLKQRKTKRLRLGHWMKKKRENGWTRFTQSKLCNFDKTSKRSHQKCYTTHPNKNTTFGMSFNAAIMTLQGKMTSWIQMSVLPPNKALSWGVSADYQPSVSFKMMTDPIS